MADRPTAWCSGPPATSGPGRSAGSSSTRSSTWSASTSTRRTRSASTPASCAGSPRPASSATDDIDDDPGPRARTACCTCRRAATSTRCAGCSRPASTSSRPAASSTTRPASTPTCGTRVEAACREGGTSIHSTGSSPGFISEAVPLVLTSIQRRLDRLQIDEFADLSQARLARPCSSSSWASAPTRPASTRPGGPTARRASGPPCACWPRRSAMPLDSVEASGEVATAAPHDRHRRRHHRGRDRRRAAHDRRRACGTAEPLLDLPRQLVLHDRARSGLGSRSHRVAGRRSTATRRSTSTCASPSRSSGWARCRPGFTANRAVNAVPIRLCRRPWHPHHRSTCPRSSPPWGTGGGRDILTRLISTLTSMS